MLDLLPLPEKLKAFLRFRETHVRNQDSSLFDDYEFFSEDGNTESQ